MQYSALQCSAVQCSAVQCSAVQCSAVQCSAVLNSCRVQDTEGGKGRFQATRTPVLQNYAVHSAGDCRGELYSEVLGSVN